MISDDPPASCQEARLEQGKHVRPSGVGFLFSMDHVALGREAHLLKLEEGHGPLGTEGKDAGTEVHTEALDSGCLGDVLVL